MSWPRFFRCYLLSLLVLNLAACSTMQPVSVEQAMHHSPPTGIDFGSLVEIETLDNERANFRITEIGNDGLGGKPGFYRYEDMKSLRVQKQPQSEGGNIGGYILGVLGVIGLIALISSADHVAVCSPSPCTFPE
jgi:hypothetical protein